MGHVDASHPFECTITNSNTRTPSLPSHTSLVLSLSLSLSLSLFLHTHTHTHTHTYSHTRTHTLICKQVRLRGAGCRRAHAHDGRHCHRVTQGPVGVVAGQAQGKGRLVPGQLRGRDQGLTPPFLHHKETHACSCSPRLHRTSFFSSLLGAHVRIHTRVFCHCQSHTSTMAMDSLHQHSTQ